MKLLCRLGAAAALAALVSCASPAPADRSSKAPFTVAWAGVTTLLFDDGETAFITDGYFTRSPQSLTTGLAPSAERITEGLRKLNAGKLAAVIPLHTHFDHALDSPAVARQTGALLVGSSSAANIGRGYGLAEDRIKVVGDRERMKFGKFTVTFLRSAHLPGVGTPGEITQPLTMPARRDAFKVGDCYTLLVEHSGRAVLVQGSAGFLPGALSDAKADVIFLGAGGLGRDEMHLDFYWREAVMTPKVRRVIPVHWDNFWVPLADPPVPQPAFEKALAALQARAQKEGIEIRIPPVWERIDPFAGLK